MSHFTVYERLSIEYLYALPFLNQSINQSGPIQVGMPPETIKDSLASGLPVPRFFIVPRERFYRDMGSNIGINVAEFEFPAYYNFFFTRKSVNLIVESQVTLKAISIVYK